MEKNNKISVAGWLAGFGILAYQYILYRLGDFLSRVFGTIDFAWCPKIEVIDNFIPLIKPFALIYVYSYLFWIIGVAVVSKTKRENFYNFLIGFSLVYFLGFLVFTFFPSYMDRTREGLMEIRGEDDLFSYILALVYKSDGGERAWNLFPSFHCISSVYCFLGIYRQKEISRGFKIYTLITAILICMSTVFTKQHYILDSLFGILLSILVYTLISIWNPGAKIAKKKKKRNVVIYIHGKGGDSTEKEHYEALFKDSDVLGFHYLSSTPWDFKVEFEKYLKDISKEHKEIIVVANSIGAFFALSSGCNLMVSKLYLISPIVDMEGLIEAQMTYANVTEDELKEQKTIETTFGETLSYEYLCYVREHPIAWSGEGHIIMGELDHLQSVKQVSDFAKEQNMDVFVFPSGEHYFHTKEQMEAIDNWIISCRK